MKAQIDTLQEEKATFEAKIAEIEQTVEGKVAEAVQIQMTEVGTQLEQAKAEKDEFYRVQIEAIETQHKSFVELVKADFTVQIEQVTREKDELTVQIDSLNETITQANLEMDAKVTESNQTLVRRFTVWKKKQKI